MTRGSGLFGLARRATHSLHISPAVSVERCVVVEARQAPAATRALSDLRIRRAIESDLPAVAALDARPVALFQGRLGRGDLIYLGELDQNVICATCFHQGPSPFDEERAIFTRWSLDDETSYWSYDAMAPAPLRAAGVVAKLFEVALRQLFEAQGARQVRGFIHDWNNLSLLLHERMGFKVIGAATAVGFLGLKWVRWEDADRSRQWLLPRNSDLSLPPAMN